MISRALPILALCALLSASAAVTVPVSAKSAGWRWIPPCSNKPSLVCVLKPTMGNKVRGFLQFKSVKNPSHQFWLFRSRRCLVQVSGRLTHLTPGNHGMHIHAYGDDRSRDATATGGHFLNPWFLPVNHGMPNNGTRHWGDFGNIHAHPSGVSTFNFQDRVITLKGIAGRSIVVHAGEDQGPAAQPSGASGPRQASCVIGYANPTK